METSQRLIELKRIYDTIKKKCRYVNCKQYEPGLPLDKNWQTFDGFVKDNWFRYYRAKVKWKDYKKLIIRKGRSNKLKINHVWFARKVPKLGYTKENTVFTSPSDLKKYSKSTHKYIFENKLLGTRDIKNILKKRGINITMEGLVHRLNSGYDLFTANIDDKIKWKGKFRSFLDIAKLEGVSYDVLKKNYYKIRDIRKAIDKTQESKPLTYYEFEGQFLTRTQISKILSKRTGILWATISERIKKHGLDLDKILHEKNSKKHSRLVKKIIAEKDGKIQKFDSLADAAKELKLHGSCISNVLKGRYKQTGGYYFKYHY